MNHKKSDLPYGGQFTPYQTDLIKLLKIIDRNKGNLSEIKREIISSFFTSNPESQRGKLAGNTILALKAYQLIDDKGVPTDIANQLISNISNPDKVYEMLATHILVNLRGIELVQTMQDMTAAGQDITLESLHRELRNRGIRVPRGSMYISAMKGWLGKAGIFTNEDHYIINNTRVESLIGASESQLEALAELTQEQRAYLRALANLQERNWLVSSRVADYAHTLYGISFSEKELPKQVLFPLANMGYVEVKKTTAGRGAKPYLVKTMEKFDAEVVLPLMESLSKSTRIGIKLLRGKSLRDILRDMRSSDKHMKGKALEFLAIYITRLLDLQFIAWRLRSKQTAGAEVDVIVEGARLIFSRWQIQCKNTKVVNLDDIAKEVGLSLRLKSTVILTVTTGSFARPARNYANEMMQDTNLNIALINGSDLQRIAANPMDLVTVLNREAEHAMEIKKIEI